MASVRSAVKFNEQNLVTLSMAYDSSIVYDPSFYSSESTGGNDNHSAQVGMAVALTANGQVGLGTAGSALFGKLLAVEPDACTVAIAGTLQFTPATTNPPLLGHGVTVDGTGKVSSAATAVDAEAGSLVIHPSYLSDDGVTTVAVVALARN